MKRAEGAQVTATALVDGGVVEAPAKTLPSILQTLDPAMSPEGGDLVMGLCCWSPR
ncbi:hypothetical protein ACLEPN_16565 [Myxococcus sp. 1LA]